MIRAAKEGFRLFADLEKLGKAARKVAVKELKAAPKRLEAKGLWLVRKRATARRINGVCGWIASKLHGALKVEDVGTSTC